MDDDHSYNGPALPGDPLAVIKDFAVQVAAKGIRKIEGHVYVDTSLMPDGEHEGGTGVTMSSIMVNDNILDLSAKPGEKVGDPVALGVSPQTSYFHFVSAVTTGPAESKLLFDATDPAARPMVPGKSPSRVVFPRAAGNIRLLTRSPHPRNSRSRCCRKR